jgi:hypothetical protein
MVARKPVLTKLDDDGETQMDMCTFPFLQPAYARAVAAAGLPFF